MQAPNLPEPSSFSISSLLKSSSGNKDANVLGTLASSSLNNFTNHVLNQYSTAGNVAAMSLPPYPPINLNLSKKEPFLLANSTWAPSFLSMLPQERNFLDMYQSLFNHAEMDLSNVAATGSPSMADSISIKYNLLKKCNLLLNDSSKYKSKLVASTPPDLFHIRGIIASK